MKTVLVAAIISIFIVAPILGLVNANPNPEPAPPSISVTWTPNLLKNTITLKIQVLVPYDTNNCTREAWYSLDRAGNISIPLVYEGMLNVGSYMPPQSSNVTGQIDMPMWSQGPHVLTVSTKYTYENFILPGSETLYIGEPEPTPTVPILTVISPKNQATYTNQVPITYNINSKVIWSYYALDTVGEPQSSDWKSFNANTTLTGLSQGSHKIVISVKTEANPPSVPVSEQTISFNVDSSVSTSPSPTPTSTPTVPEFSWLVIVPLLLSIFSVAVILRQRKTTNIR